MFTERILNYFSRQVDNEPLPFVSPETQNRANRIQKTAAYTIAGLGAFTFALSKIIPQTSFTKEAFELVLLATPVALGRVIGVHQFFQTILNDWKTLFKSFGAGALTTIALTVINSDLTIHSKTPLEIMMLSFGTGCICAGIAYEMENRLRYPN